MKKSKLVVGQKYLLKTQDGKKYFAAWNGERFINENVTFNYNDLRTVDGPVVDRPQVFVVGGEETYCGMAPCIQIDGQWVQVGDSRPDKI